MARSMTVLFIAGLAALASPAPGEVIIEEIEGLRVLEEQTDLDFEGYQTWAPQLVDHLDPAGEAAAGMQAAYRIWGGDDIDGVITNLTLWPTADDAARYVDRAARDAAGLGLRAQDSPFGDVLAFAGTDADGAFFTYYTWRHETYGVAMVAAGESMTDTLNTAALDQQAALDAATSTAPAEGDGTSDSDGGVPIGTVLILVGLIALVIWLLVRVRGKMRDADTRQASDEQQPPDDS